MLTAALVNARTILHQDEKERPMVDVPSTKPVPPEVERAPPSSTAINAREYFAGVILQAIMGQQRAATPQQYMKAAWQYADEMQYIGVWGRTKEEGEE
jgi:hypothetical protein